MTILRQYNHFAYVLWGNRYGWIDTKLLPQDEMGNTTPLQVPDTGTYSTLLPDAGTYSTLLLPDFLTSEQQLEFLRGEACAEVQGYAIGRPAPVDALEGWTDEAVRKALAG